MNPEQIQQYECRWMPDAGMSVIATSERNRDAVAKWSSRLKPLYRVPVEERTDQVPGLSTVYATFRSGEAAFIWRCWDVEALRVGEDPAVGELGTDSNAERHPLVARALVGPIRLMTPELAMILSVNGFPAGPDLPSQGRQDTRAPWRYPAEIGPCPGQVRPDTVLPPFQLSDVREPGPNARLESLARRVNGLSLLIAATLREPGIPASVIIPERLRGRLPHENPEIALLWGLHKTAVPLLGEESPAWKPDFSTHEAPRVEGGADAAAHISFRNQPFADQPVGGRLETIVNLYEALTAGDEGTDLEGQVGACLALAYKEYGAQRLVPILNRITADTASLGDRLARVLHEPELKMFAQQPPVPPRTAKQENLVDPRHSPPPDPGAHESVPVPDPAPGTPTPRRDTIPDTRYIRTEAVEDLELLSLYYGLERHAKLPPLLGVQAAMISKKAAHHHVLPARDRLEAARILHKNRLFVGQCTTLNPHSRALVVEQVADLITPVLRGGLQGEDLYN
ncbi:MAG: hypothetical protein ABIS86_05860, partial [Streptosporangiaceae bacterium]